MSSCLIVVRISWDKHCFQDESGVKLYATAESCVNIVFFPANDKRVDKIVIE